MKRKLLVLSISFLGLWVACLFFPGRTSSIHIALIIELIFFMHYLVIKMSPVVKEIPEEAVMDQLEQETEADNDFDSRKSGIMQTHLTAEKQEEEVFS